MSNNVDFHIPEEWIGNPVILSYDMVVSDAKGNQGLFNAAGELVADYGTSIQIRHEQQGDVLVPKHRIHHMVKISKIAMAQSMPSPLLGKQ